MMDQKTRTKYAYLEGWVSIVGNTGLFFLKISVGFSINSISLIADAFHTLSDVLTSVVVIIGFMIAKTPADKHHPHGHGRMEAISTIIIAVLLGVVGFEFGKGSIQRFIHPEPVKGTWLAILILFGSAAIKEWMARFSFSLGKKINSSALHADGWHHRSDAIASALIPIAIIAAMFKIYWLDAIFGLAVSALIAYTGIEILCSTADKLMGHAPDQEFLEKIKKCVMSIRGVRGVHDIAVHDYGQRNEISLHIQVDEGIDIKNAHEIADRVEEKIKTDILSETGTATVHMDVKED